VGRAAKLGEGCTRSGPYAVVVKMWELGDGCRLQGPRWGGLRSSARNNTLFVTRDRRDRRIILRGKRTEMVARGKHFRETSPSAAARKKAGGKTSREMAISLASRPSDRLLGIGSDNPVRETARTLRGTTSRWRHFATIGGFGPGASVWAGRPLRVHRSSTVISRMCRRFPKRPGKRDEKLLVLNANRAWKNARLSPGV